MSPRDHSRRRFLRRAGGSLAAGAFLAAAGCAEPTDSEPNPGESPETVPGPAETTAGESPTPTERVPDLPPVEGSWPTYRSDAGNTGATADPGPVERPRTVWETVVTPGRPAVPPAAADGTVFLVGESGAVRALSAADGSVRWTGSRRVSTDVAPVVGDGVVVVADGATLVALGAGSGRERWTVPLDRSVVGLAATDERFVAATEGGVTGIDPAGGARTWDRPVDGTVSAGPAAGGDTVAVGLASGDVVAVAAESGERRWRNAVTGSGRAVPAVAAGSVYATGGPEEGSPGGRTLVAFDAPSGSERWSRRTAYPVGGPLVATTDGVFVGTIDANRRATPPEDGSGSGTPTPYPTDTMGYRAAVQRLAPADGSVQWRQEFGGTYNFTAGPPSVTLALAAGTLLAGIRQTVSAYDPDTGDRRWSAGLDGPGVAVTDGVVTTGTEAVGLADGSGLWEYESGDTVGSSPAVVGNTAYVGSDDHHVYAVTANTGSVEWRARTDGIVRAAPTVDADTVYVGTLEGTVYALRRSDGTERWTFDAGDTVEWGGALVDGVLYPGLFDSAVLALDAADGTELWRTDPGGRFVTGAPAVGDGAVVAGRNGVLAAFETADGRERWSHAFGEEPRVQSDAAIADGRAFVHVGQSLRAFDVASGEPVWSREVGQSNSAPAVKDGAVYASTDRGVYAFDAADGADRWHVPTNERRRVVAGDGAVYVVHYDAPAVALDPADGSELWQDSRGTAASTPAVADDYLFFGTTDGALRALGPRSG